MMIAFNRRKIADWWHSFQAKSRHSQQPRDRTNILFFPSEAEWENSLHGLRYLLEVQAQLQNSDLAKVCSLVNVCLGV